VKPSDEKLDQTILSVSLAGWQKVAMILGKSFRQLEGEGIQTSWSASAASKARATFPDGATARSGRQPPRQ
jgi:hypothetical protein